MTRNKTLLMVVVLVTNLVISTSAVANCMSINDITATLHAKFKGEHNDTLFKLGLIVNEGEQRRFFFFHQGGHWLEFVGKKGLQTVCFVREGRGFVFGAVGDKT